MNKPHSYTKKVVYKNKWLTLLQDDILHTKDALPYQYTYIERTHTGVAVIPYSKSDDSIILVSQYRHPVKKVVLGFPGGGIEKGSNPLETAKKELLEETGFEAEEFIDLGSYFPNVGIQADEGRVFVALNPKKVQEPRKEANEVTKPIIKTTQEVRSLINKGDIRDGWSIGPFLLFSLWLNEYKSKKVIHE